VKKKTVDRRYLKIAAVAVAAAVILLMMVWVRAFIGSMRAWEQGEALLQQKKYVRAVTFFDRSIHWYAPFNPYVEKSARRLWEIGSRAEREGDVMLALIAFRSIRRGFYGIESVYSPGKAWIEKSNARIGNLSQGGRAKEQRAVKKDLPPPPGIFWSVLLEVGFLGWLGTMAVLAVRLFKRGGGGRVTVSSCIGWGALSVCFFVLWVIGLLKA
jgi:hypothetical protein